MVKQKEHTNDNGLKPWQNKLHEIIFEADTPSGKYFDILLLYLILLSVAAVMLESVASIREKHGYWLNIIEWIVTIAFSIEYILRIISVKRPLNYITSYYGIIDLLSILPSYIGLFFVQSHYLTVIRSLRLLRVFRVLKLSHYIKESVILIIALRKSRRKIMVFLYFVLLITVILGSLMYVIESEYDSGFTSIPQSIYWAIVTLTTVGYGDIAPVSPLGKFIASCIMILGYSIIAIPTGLVGVEFNNAMKNQDNLTTQNCPNCLKEGHDKDAIHCKYCGHKLN
ncbi:MAG: ion transporter [Bacteroidia bacterium]